MAVGARARFKGSAGLAGTTGLGAAAAGVGTGVASGAGVGVPGV